MYRPYRFGHNHARSQNLASVSNEKKRITDAVNATSTVDDWRFSSRYAPLRTRSVLGHARKDFLCPTRIILP